VIPDFPVAESLGCRALKDGALYLVFLLAAAALLTACLYALPRIARFFDDRILSSRRQTTFSKGVKR
jgi:hypothetical protein